MCVYDFAAFLLEVTKNACVNASVASSVFGDRGCRCVTAFAASPVVTKEGSRVCVCARAAFGLI